MSAIALIISGFFLSSSIIVIVAFPVSVPRILNYHDIAANACLLRSLGSGPSPTLGLFCTDVESCGRARPPGSRLTRDGHDNHGGLLLHNLKPITLHQDKV
jgi:hypothetical protein